MLYPNEKIEQHRGCCVNPNMNMAIDHGLAKTRMEIVTRYLNEYYGITPEWYDEPLEDGSIGLAHCPHRCHHSDYDASDENPRKTLRIFVDRKDFSGTSPAATLDKQPKIFLSCRHTNHCVPMVWEDTVNCRKLEESTVPAALVLPSPQRSILDIVKHREQWDKQKVAAEAGERFLNEIIASANGVYPSEEDIMRMSPLPIGKGKVVLQPYTQTKLQLELYPMDELIWVGEVEMSNKPGSIRTTRDWIKQIETFERSPMINEDSALWVWPGHFIAPSSFQSTDGGRTKANMNKRLFAVAEADKLNRNEQLLVIKSILEDKRFPVAYVINSGSKSYHIGLKTQTLTAEDEAYLSGISNRAKITERGRPKARIGGMGFDPASLRPVQGVRLAGPNHPRTGNAQRLIYINPNLSYND